MTELRRLLEREGIRKAVVIDDVFDDAPRPEELHSDDWSNFFDDLNDRDETLLSKFYTGYEKASTDDLKSSQEFVAILWDNRHELISESVKNLFAEYEDTRTTERRRLDDLVDALQTLGLSCSTKGRDFDVQTVEDDLIFIDLFLGFHQSDDDMDRAIQRIHNLIKNRVEYPPLVVLMSRSPRLDAKRNEFRDKAGLLGSTFRVIRKAELAKEGVLEAMLSRLVSHYDDAKRISRFVYTWERGLMRVRKNLIQILRRLDLSDLGQIRALLLAHEGQTLGEYLLDVADRVLQYEIEGDDETITAALELNEIDLNKYPAPHLIGTPDLQDLVYRMVFLHSKRLSLSEDGGIVHLQFGDILRWKANGSETFGDNVSLVVSPACDLVRGGTEYVMLLCGVLEELHPGNWSYKADPLRTAIIILPDENRRWIKWNPRNIKTLSWRELDRLIKQEKRLERIGRLREVCTIEIQQKLLAYLGRIGRPANLPVSFPVTVSFFYVDPECKARKLLNVQSIESAVCYVGRDANSQPIHRLVLTEQTCDQMDQAFRMLEADTVHISSHPSLVAVKADRVFFTRFERGEINISPNETGKKYIKTTDNKTDAAVVTRNDTIEEGSDVPRNLRKVALIVNVMDIPKDGVD